MKILRQVCCLFAVSTLLLVFSGCVSNENSIVIKVRNKANEIQAKERIQAAIVMGPLYGDDHYKGIAYVRDDRVRLCFAYIWGGGAWYGGPGLTEVSCEKVRHLLAPSQQEKMAQEEAAR